MPAASGYAGSTWVGPDPVDSPDTHRRQARQPKAATVGAPPDER